MTRLIAFVAVLLAAVVGLSAPALGGASESFFEVDPTSAPPGGTVTADGFCPDDVNEWTAVFFYLDIPDATEEPTFLDVGNFPITAGVPWTFELTIPAEATPGETTIAKQCARVDEGGNFAGGEGTQRQDFVVLEPTTDTTDTTDTTTPSSESTLADTAPAARPRFTG
jgi:hypothetical protein